LQRRELLKAAVSGSVGLALIGVQRAVLAGADPDAKVSHPFLSDQQREAISALAELIIPETDTPGSIEAGVPGFIELMLSDWYSEEERRPFVDGLAGLDRRCGEQWGQPFAACSQEQKTSALRETEGSAFFDFAKELTVLGYYTSEVGANAELRWNPMPGAYKGDYDFAETGRQWAG